MTEIFPLPKLPLPTVSRLPAFLSFALSLLLFSCAGAKVKGGGQIPYEPLQKNAESRQAMAGTVKITRTHEGRSVTAPGVLLVGWPDRLRLEVQDPVGSMLAVLVIRGDQFWLYEQSRKENLMGSVQNLPGGVFVRMNAPELVAVLLARPDLSIFQRGQVEGRVASWSNGGQRQEIEWSSGRPILERWTKSLSSGLSHSVHYAHYEARSGVLFPTRLQLRSSRGETPYESFQVEWSEWETTLPSNEKLFQIPQDRQFGRPTKALP